MACRNDGGCPQCNPTFAAMLSRDRPTHPLTDDPRRLVVTTAHPTERTAPEPPSLVDAIQAARTLTTPQALTTSPNVNDAPPPPSLIDAIKARKDRQHAG